MQTDKKNPCTDPKGRHNGFDFFLGSSLQMKVQWMSAMFGFD